MKPLLYALLQNHDPVQGYKKRKKRKTSENLCQDYNKNQRIIWNEGLQTILNSVIDYLKSPEIIAYPDFEKPFFVNCEGSGDGLGAVLYQKQNDINRVISYASRTRTYVLTTAKLNAVGLHWVAELADFNFSLKY